MISVCARACPALDHRDPLRRARDLGGGPGPGHRPGLRKPWMTPSWRCRVGDVGLDGGSTRRGVRAEVARGWACGIDAVLPGRVIVGPPYSSCDWAASILLCRAVEPTRHACRCGWRCRATPSMANRCRPISQPVAGSGRIEGLHGGAQLTHELRDVIVARRAAIEPLKRCARRPARCRAEISPRL